MKPARGADDALQAAFFVLLALVPLAWTKGVVAEFTLPKFVALNFGLFLAAWAAARRPDALASGRTALDRPLAALLACAVLSASVSDDRLISFLGRYDSYVHGVWGMTLVVLTAQLAARGARGRQDAPVRLLSWAVAAIGGYAIVQRLGWDPIFRIQDLPNGGRAVSTLGSPVDLGAYLALTSPLLLWRADVERSPVSAALFLLASGGLYCTGSRGAMMAAAAGAVSYALMSRRDPVPALRRACALAVVLVGAAAAWASRAGASPSDRGRIEVWKSSFQMFLDRPWLGSGPDGFEEYFRLHRSDAFIAVVGPNHYQAYAHNDILHVLTTMGVLGFLAYAWLAASLLKAGAVALGRAKDRRLAAALCAALLALWINLELNPVSLEVWTVAAAVAGLLASLATEGEVSPAPRGVYAALAAVLTGLFLYSAASLRTDMTFKSALKAHMAGNYAPAKAGVAAARQSRPCELSYIMSEVNAITDWINADRSVEGRLKLLALLDSDVAAARSCHPRLSLPHYLAGAAGRVHYDLGFKERLPGALSEYDAALALDPKFEPLINARASAAQLQGASQ